MCIRVSVNRFSLVEAVLNLIKNARDALEESTASGDLSTPAHIRLHTGVGLNGSADRVQIEVIDSGAGIPQDILDRIFDPFFTTKARGTGLGMAIAYNIIKAHQGTIEVESQESEGSRFIVTIPTWSA